MATVELRNVTKIFGTDTKAVDNASFTVKDKEFVVLVGPSGCGKTTTLRMIAGLEEITSGELYIDGALVNHLMPKDRDIAMVFQNYALYPHMTVFDNMAFGLKIRKIPKSEIAERVREAARILSIEHLLERKPSALSGGQKQRVAVGRAIVRNPKVFLFDEPLSNLDAKLRVHMRAEISSLHRRLDTTMIYVTHDQIEAMTMADRIVVMKDGLIHQIGSPLELYNHPVNKFVAGFIGSPPMNFIDSRVSSSGDSVVLNGTDNPIGLSKENRGFVESFTGKEICVGVRPEHIEILDKEIHGETVMTNVDVVEPLGAEIHLYLVAGPHTLIAGVPARRMFKVGQTLPVRLEQEYMKFFDPATERELRAVSTGIAI